MVFKVSKGGVRSGNTLRGLNSASTKRYGRHGCLLGYTSLGRKDLIRLIRDGNHDDNQLVTETLSKTNVLLSLNKRQRWRLPALVGQMIKAGDFNKGAVVSLLEKHKLKRRANCVNMVTNSHRVRGIKPSNNKYFSFTLDNVADSQSKRERRRVRAEQLKKSVPPSIKIGGKSNDNVIETFTVEGIAPQKSQSSIFDGDRPEYRLEVFYPCPRSCSLTYNPRYTDVTVVEGQTGELEVKSNVKPKKKGIKTHRKGLLWREVERLYSDVINDDVNEVWDEFNDDDCVQNDDSVDELTNLYQQPLECTMDALLTHALKVKDLCGARGDNSCQTPPKRRDRFVSYYQEEKPHIVFVDKNGQYYKGKIETKASTSDAAIIIKAKDVQSDVNDLEYVRVILSASETNPDELARQYGALYAESSSQPRRFVIDVTDDVTNLLATSKSTTAERNFSSYLVFVYDGFYDDDLSAYSVAFNSMVGGKMAGLSELLPFTKISIPNIVNGVACYLLDLKAKNSLEFVENRKERLGLETEFLNSRMKLTVKAFNPSHEMSKTAISSSIRDNNNSNTGIADVSQIREEMENDVFCDVCYADVTSSRIDSVRGTKLTLCGHRLCDECWRRHFRTRISDGKTMMVCGGYDCDTEIGPVTLMSILNVSEIALILKRQTEGELEMMENAKWCPDPECGRVIKVDSKSNDLCVDVQCACGNKLCFSCMGPAHWPAKCDQAEEYLEKLPTIAPSKEYVVEEEKKTISPFLLNQKSKKPEAVRVVGRLCPKCKKFIEKNGGCSFMVCRCGFQMCWNCMHAYHYSGPCIQSTSMVNKLTKTVIVKHAVTRDPAAFEGKESASEPTKVMKNKQKASLYQRALQQREERVASRKYKSSYTAPLVTKMVTHSDHKFKSDLITFFSVHTPEIRIKDSSSFNLFWHLKRFMKSIVQMKKELHHVREYTYILLQATSNSVAKQRILKLSNDLNGFCSIVTSILDLQDNQDPVMAFKRLVDLQQWAERALDALIDTIQSLRLT